MSYGYDNQYPSASYAQGAGDGGFMTEVGSSQGGKKYTKESLRPVTIKQVNEATQAYPDSEFKIDGTEVTQITFVGQVRNISHLTTFITYKLDDGTGEIDVKKWMDEADKNDPMDISGPASVPDRKKIVTNGYAKVWGKISSFNNRRSVTAHVVRPLTDMNEYHFHFLEATAIHLYFTRGPSPAKIKADAAKGISAAGGAAGGAGENIGVDGRPLPHLSPIARRVYDTLSNTAQSREGLHVQHLATLLGLPVSDVYNASGELRSHGLIFDTVDDDTWALMEF